MPRILAKSARHLLLMLCRLKFCVAAFEELHAHGNLSSSGTAALSLGLLQCRLQHLPLLGVVRSERNLETLVEGPAEQQRVLVGGHACMRA